MRCTKGVASGSACGRTGRAAFGRSGRVLSVPAFDAWATPKVSVRGVALTAM
ncbi:hypothetical protein [Glutamicibacter ardleyensis]|uniref:hypothetical protein n=1 Tax=Glutamicibacter ardleyensis TaxID=225894 RepID=UPI003F8FAA66